MLSPIPHLALMYSLAMRNGLSSDQLIAHVPNPMIPTQFDPRAFESNIFVLPHCQGQTRKGGNLREPSKWCETLSDHSTHPLSGSRQRRTSKIDSIFEVRRHTGGKHIGFSRRLKPRSASLSLEGSPCRHPDQGPHVMFTLLFSRFHSFAPLPPLRID